MTSPDIRQGHLKQTSEGELTDWHLENLKVLVVHTMKITEAGNEEERCSLDTVDVLIKNDHSTCISGALWTGSMVNI